MMYAVVFERKEKKIEPWLLDQLCPLGNDGTRWWSQGRAQESPTGRSDRPAQLRTPVGLCAQCPVCLPLMSPPIPDNFFPSQEAFSSWKFPFLKCRACCPPDPGVVVALLIQRCHGLQGLWAQRPPVRRAGPFVPGCQETVSHVLWVHDILMGLFWQPFWCISFEAATAMLLFWLGILIRHLGKALYLCISLF